jgi:hypothetical protein
VDDDEKIMKRLPRATGLPLKVLKQVSPPSPAQAEKLVKAAGAMTDDVQAAIDRLTETKVIGVKLVDQRARGEEVRPETASTFLQALKEQENGGANE